MRTIGIYTHDFSVFHDVVNLLKDREVNFFSLESAEIPPFVTVVLTTRAEASQLDFRKIIIVESGNEEQAVEKAILWQAGTRRFSQLCIGIDPGEKPGMAAYADRNLLTTIKVEVPEDTAAAVKRIMDFYNYNTMIVRIGHGARTVRNRIINSLLPLHVDIEIVDEERTTIKHPTPDIQAAKQIALKEGKAVQGLMKVQPSKGEIEDIKRRSRLMSKGKFTISYELARSVAIGEMTLQQAVDLTHTKLFDP